MNPVLSFYEKRVRPIVAALTALGEKTAAREVRTCFSEDGFFKSCVAAALRVINADLRKEVNKLIKQQLKEKAGYEGKADADYYEVIKRAVRSSGVPEGDQDDIIQQILAEMFTKGGKDFFTLFESDREKDFAKFLYQRALWRGRDFLRNQGKVVRQAPGKDISLSPSSDSEDATSLDPATPLESLEDSTTYKQYLEVFDRELDYTRPALRLKELWHLFLQGKTKGEAAEIMGFRGPNITKRIKDLRDVLLEVADDYEWDEMAKMIREQVV